MQAKVIDNQLISTGKIVSKKDIKSGLGKRVVASENSESMAEYTIFQIRILTADWDIALNSETCQGTTIEERRKFTKLQTLNHF